MASMHSISPATSRPTNGIKTITQIGVQSMRFAATRVVHRVYACFGSTQAGGAYFGESCGKGGGAVTYTLQSGGDDATYKGTQTVFMSLSAMVWRLASHSGK